MIGFEDKENTPDFSDQGYFALMKLPGHARSLFVDRVKDVDPAFAVEGIRSRLAQIFRGLLDQSLDPSGASADVLHKKGSQTRDMGRSH
jgi:hypothetical protein